jgi:hypothetical protein
VRRDTPRSAVPQAGPSSVRPRLLAWLSSLRIATTDQLRALATPDAVDSEYTRKCLTQLRAGGLVDAAPIGWSHQYVWFLTRAGASAAAMINGRAAGRREVIRPAIVRSGVLEHALEVTATVVALAGAGAGPECWRLEALHRFKIGPIDQKLLADAVLRAPGQDVAELPETLIIELDRATMQLGRLAGELAAYRDYARARLASRAAGGASIPVYARDYPGARRLPPVLVVLSGATPEALERRRRRLCTEAAAAAEDSLDVGVTTLAELQQHGPAAAIVTRLYSPAVPVPLARLARSRPRAALTGP